MKKTKKPPPPVIAMDIGGTKIASGVVTRSGKILDAIREPVQISKGKTAFLDHLGEIINKHRVTHPEVKSVGIACAGPLDSYGGTLLDPTNFRTNGKTWGLFPLVKELKRRFPRMNIYLENDAAAAILAEKWVGAAIPYENSMIMTLGTGLGAAAICNGKLARAAYNLHPDAGLILVNYDDKTALCGSGNYGSAEAYLSGVNFTKRVQKKTGDSELHSRAIVAEARKGNKKVLDCFKEYAEVFAVTIYNYATIYGPQIVILSGSFAEAADLFVPDVLKLLKELLKRRRVGEIDLMPKIVASPLGNMSCLLGGAYVAHFPDQRETPH